MGGSLMMMGAGILFYLSTNYYLLLFAAIIGIITPGAHEVGPFRALQVRLHTEAIQKCRPDIVKSHRKRYLPSSPHTKHVPMSTPGLL